MPDRIRHDEDPEGSSSVPCLMRFDKMEFSKPHWFILARIKYPKRISFFLKEYYRENFSSLGQRHTIRSFFREHEFPFVFAPARNIEEGTNQIAISIK